MTSSPSFCHSNGVLSHLEQRETSLLIPPTSALRKASINCKHPLNIFSLTCLVLHLLGLFVCVPECVCVFSLAACLHKSVWGPSFALSYRVGCVLSKLFTITARSASNSSGAGVRFFCPNIPRLSSRDVLLGRGEGRAGGCTG